MKKLILVAALLPMFAASALAADEAPSSGSSSPVADAKNAVKSGTRAVGHATRDTTRAIGHGTRDAAKAIGHGTRDAAKGVGHAAKNAWGELTGNKD
jgi:hypothetical protein